MAKYGRYAIVKMNALEFLKDHEKVYICKAKRNNHMYIIFDPKDLTPNYEIIETLTQEEIK